MNIKTNDRIIIDTGGFKLGVELFRFNDRDVVQIQFPNDVQLESMGKAINLALPGRLALVKTKGGESQ